MRGSDPDAALYYLARMLVAGEDPLFIARRLVRMANEDMGLADPEALHQALAAKETYDFLGSPEGELALAQATVYIATAPKSNALYTAFKGGDGARQADRLADAAEDHLMRKLKSQNAGYDEDQPDAFRPELFRWHAEVYHAMDRHDYEPDATVSSGSRICANNRLDPNQELAISR